MARYCEKLVDVLGSDDRFRKAFDDAAGEVRKAAQGNLHRDNIRTETFTDTLIRQLRGNQVASTIAPTADDPKS
jgi:hypothetical protein